jgi:predicted nucleic acid-binding protein
MTEVFVDTNVLLRHVLQDHRDHSPRATAFLLKVQSGQVEAESSSSVVAEAVFTMERTYKRAKADIRDALGELISLPTLLLPGKEMVLEALEIYAGRNISYIDAYHAALLRRRGISTIVSFDPDFDRVPWLTRVEP